MSNSQAPASMVCVTPNPHRRLIAKTPTTVPQPDRIHPRRLDGRRWYHRCTTLRLYFCKTTHTDATQYIRAGSIPSLVAGCSVGALYALGGYRIQNRQTYGIELALLASIVLAGSSIPRAIKSQKPLPIALSVVAAFGLFNYGMAIANRRS